MALFLFIWTLLLVMGVDGGATESCSASSGTSFTLSVASRRNLTGHWLVLMDGVSELPKQSSTRSSPVEVAIDVRHRSGTCGDKETVQLTASAVASADPPEQESTVSEMVTTSADHVTTTTADATSSVTVPTSQAPPTGYEVVNGLGSYNMHSNALPWEQARDTCAQEGGHLLIINSEHEAEVARALLERNKSKIHDARDLYFAWVGFDDIVTEGDYITVLGEPLSSSGYTLWSSSMSHNQRDWNCGAVWKDGSLFVWNCDWKYSFICEISAQ